MARRPPIAPPQRPTLTVEQKRRGIVRLEKRIEELQKFDPQKVGRRFTDPNVTAIETAIDEALSAAFGHGTVEYNRYQRATSLDHGSVTMQVDPMWGGRGGSFYDEAQEARQFATEGKEESLALLRQAVKSLTEEIEDEEGDPARDRKPASSDAGNLSKVFVVHGHDTGASQAVARFLEKLELEAIILQSSQTKA